MSEESENITVKKTPKEKKSTKHSKFVSALQSCNNTITNKETEDYITQILNLKTLNLIPSSTQNDFEIPTLSLSSPRTLNDNLANSTTNNECTTEIKDPEIKPKINKGIRNLKKKMAFKNSNVCVVS